MEDEFYASIKLISGEEIISKVIVSEEEVGTILILDSPVVMETTVIRQMGVTTLRVEPWLKYSDDSMCIIHLDKVITVSEIRDDAVIKVYEKYLKSKNKQSGKTKVTPNMGYLCSIKEARETLERIYKKN